ncbi:hypothetical protein ACFX1Q_047342 [Malus domestica]
MNGGALAEEPPMPKLKFREKECLENIGIFAKVLELAFWNDSCFGVIKEAWDTPVFSIPMFQTRAKLGAILGLPLTSSYLADRDLLGQRLETLQGKEECYWHQRFRVLWMKDGDQNTRFSTTITAKERTGLIRGISIGNRAPKNVCSTNRARLASTLGVKAMIFHEKLEGPFVECSRQGFAALLTKQVWRLIFEADSLVAKILKENYYPYMPFSPKLMGITLSLVSNLIVPASWNWDHDLLVATFSTTKDYFVEGQCSPKGPNDVLEIV